MGIGANGFHGWLMYLDFEDSLDLNLETPTKILKDFGNKKKLD
jgi:hypothetical protein